MFQEARSIAKARRLGVATPALFAVDSVLHTITLEHIGGTSVKDILLRSGPLPSLGMN
jgi:TP53 regulating kinase-like protein